MTALFFNWTRKPAPLALLLKAPFVTVKLVITDAELTVELKSTLSPNEPATEVLVSVTVPLASVICTPLSVATVPLLVTEQLISERLSTVVPRMPLCESVVMFIFVRLTPPPTLVRLTPAVVVFWIVPPLPAEPVPLTTRPPDAPVLLSEIPLAGPLAAVPAETLLNFRPPAPIGALSPLIP